MSQIKKISKKTNKKDIVRRVKNHDDDDDHDDHEDETRCDGERGWHVGYAYLGYKYSVKTR